MANQILSRRERRKQAELPEPTRGPCRAARHPAHQQLLPAEAAATLMEPEEVLVADPRGGLTPAQMVEQKLLALLGTGHPGLFLQAAGGRQDLRRVPGAREAPARFSRTPDAAPPGSRRGTPRLPEA